MAKAPGVLLGKSIVGGVQMAPLASVQPNPWNPNVMREDVLASLEYGLRNDGWLASQALLIWGTDESGAARNYIIDGEHRHRVAQDLGMTHGPMVFLENVPEAKARSLTVAMNHRRGESDERKLAALLKSLVGEIADLPENLGIAQGDVDKLLALSVEPVPPALFVQAPLPSFLPVTEEEQGVLDSVALTTCPRCGHAFRK